MWKTLRITFLLFLLLLAAGHTWLTRLRTSSWEVPLLAVVYPINGDGSAAAADYIKGLTPDDFAPVADFLSREGARYKLALREPVSVALGGEVRELPPAQPVGGNLPQVMFWSLRLRWWAWRHNDYPWPADIRLYLQYYDPATHRSLDHSLGLEKGMIGVAKLFAARRDASRNNVVIAHELLHTLGATDKYDPADGRPLYPDGYGEPQRQPRYPQKVAEVMGGSIPLSQADYVMPDSLGQAVIGPATAREIGW